MTAPVFAWMRRNGLNVKREFSLPWGICDLVGVSFNERRVGIRIAHGQFHPIATPQRISLLHKIPDEKTHRSIAITDLYSRFDGLFSTDTLERELDHLIRGKFVRSLRSGRFQSRNGWAPLHKRIVAVELKLNRIQEAFEQACCNRAFASESYVALPSRTARRLIRSHRLAPFREHRIGILAVGPRSCMPVLPSSCQPQNSLLQAHCVERFWQTRDSCS
jgi:hypothetical protein